MNIPSQCQNPSCDDVPAWLCHVEYGQGTTRTFLCEDHSEPNDLLTRVRPLMTPSGEPIPDIEVLDRLDVTVNHTVHDSGLSDSTYEVKTPTDGVCYVDQELADRVNSRTGLDLLGGSYSSNGTVRVGLRMGSD